MITVYYIVIDISLTKFFMIHYGDIGMGHLVETRLG